MPCPQNSGILTSAGPSLAEPPNQLMAPARTARNNSDIYQLTADVPKLSSNFGCGLTFLGGTMEAGKHLQPRHVVFFLIANLGICAATCVFCLTRNRLPESYVAKSFELEDDNGFIHARLGLDSVTTAPTEGRSKKQFVPSLEFRNEHSIAPRIRIADGDGGPALSLCNGKQFITVGFDGDNALAVISDGSVDNPLMSIRLDFVANKLVIADVNGNSLAAFELPKKK